MAAVGRSWVMETQGTYQAGQSADDSATPEKVLTMRPYTKKDNAYADRLIGVVSPSAYYLLDYLIRQTVGFHRETVRYSSKQLAAVTKLSQRTIFTAIRELEALRVLAKDAGDMGRTQIRTFRLLPSDAWCLPERDTQTTANFAVVEKRKRTTAKNTVDERVTTANFAEDAPQTTAKFADLIKKEESKEKREKENDANASSDADAPTPRKRTSSRPRKLSDEQYAAKKLEEEWIAAIFAGMETINGYPVTGKGKERAAAHDLYRYRGPKNRDAVLSPERILDCYRLTLIDPFYATQQLGLHTILKVIGAYLRSPENYRAGMEEKRHKAEYARTAANGHKSQRPAGREQTYAKTGEDMAPKGWS